MSIIIIIIIKHFYQGQPNKPIISKSITLIGNQLSLGFSLFCYVLLV